MAQIVTITNPLTGQPAQVDQLDHTAQEIDDAIARALPGGAIDTALQNKLGGIESTDYPGCYYRTVDGVVEWINPPMQAGVEYRTTERYLGKPVYVRTKEISALAIGSSSSPARTNISDFTSECDKIVRYEMYVTPASGGAKFPIPFIEATTGVLKASGSLNEGQYLYGSIYSFDDLSGYKANVTCWYTKTTD